MPARPAAPEAFAIVCSGCDKPVMMDAKAVWEHRQDPHDGLPERWTAAQCPKCGQSALYLQEDYGDGWDDEHYRMYPPEERNLGVAVPRHLRNDYSEARGCFRMKAYTAAAIMSRRIVEGICNDQGESKGNLVQRLERMRDSGVIDKRLYEWADACRQVGNEGAHASGSSVSREDAEEVLQFVEALLDYMYVFQARYEAFAARRSASRSNAPAKALAKPAIRVKRAAKVAPRKAST